MRHYGIAVLLFLIFLWPAGAIAGTWEVETYEKVVLKRSGAKCADDRHCINRLHPQIEPAARAKAGQLIIFETRDAGDSDRDLNTPPDTQANFNFVHPVTGPVYIEGAERGDVLAVTIIDVAPSEYGYTSIGGIGFIADLFEKPATANWRLNRQYAESDQLPGVRIPYAAFPGIVTVMPGPDEVIAWRDREAALLEAGGTAPPPNPADAVPAHLCGPSGTDKEACLRTIPPREHGGNMDIKYLVNGTTVLLPCYIEGCGLGIGDVHYAQGDGEVAGTAIEMAATVTVKTEVRKGMGSVIRQPHYEGHRQLQRLAPARFYATTGIPVKKAGFVPPQMAYLESQKIAGLTNLSRDISLAARNALIDMIDYIVRTRGYTREQAYLLASVAVDLRIAQLVDGANYGASAILPLDIFVDSVVVPAAGP